MDVADLTTQIVAGAAIGNLAVSDILLGDVLISVQDLSAATSNKASEFTVTADGNINNTNGTLNSGGHLVLVQWMKKYKFRHKFEAGATNRSGRSPF